MPQVQEQELAAAQQETEALQQQLADQRSSLSQLLKEAQAENSGLRIALAKAQAVEVGCKMCVCVCDLSCSCGRIAEVHVMCAHCMWLLMPRLGSPCEGSHRHPCQL